MPDMILVPRFRTRLRVALEEGLVLGVKYSLVTLLLVGTISFLTKDYLQTRLMAQRGNAAFEYIEKALEVQRKAAEPKP